MTIQAFVVLQRTDPLGPTLERSLYVDSLPTLSTVFAQKETF
jgi:hypothetical protein